MIVRPAHQYRKSGEAVMESTSGRSAITFLSDVPRNISRHVSKIGLKAFAVLCVGAYLMAIGVEILLSWWMYSPPLKRKDRHGLSPSRRKTGSGQSRRQT